MILIVECVIGIILFTLIAVPMTAKNPLEMIDDYPPAIHQKCVELGIVENAKRRLKVKDVICKLLTILVLISVTVVVMIFINQAKSFSEGFWDTFAIWCSITWFDALFIDYIWFCHSKKIQIPGTEGMKEYKDYLFHNKQSCIGTLLGIPASAVMGFFVTMLNLKG